MLWSGVKAFDVSSKESFDLRAMCIWSVHDFPMYGLFVGCVTKGHVRCPPYGLAIDFHSSKKLKKMKRGVHLHGYLHQNIIEWAEEQKYGYKDLEIELGRNMTLFTKMGSSN